MKVYVILEETLDPTQIHPSLGSKKEQVLSMILVAKESQLQS